MVVDRDTRLREGALALVRTTGRGRGQAKVVRMLGRTDVARDVLEALMLHRGLRRSFDPHVDRAAREAEPAEVPRRDLRDLPTFTIDPATARDFDDAISAERLGPDAWRIWVHIADVTAYVRPGSPVDREAHRRATSVYVPSLVEPMLPEALSNGACSLVPHQDRLAVTVELEVRGPKVVKSGFARSVIRSDERLDYDRVDRIFAGPRAGGRAVGSPPVGAARGAAAALGSASGRRRRSRSTPAEPEFRFDSAGHGDLVLPDRADRVAPPDRAPDDRRERGGRSGCSRTAGCPRCTRARASPSPEAVQRPRLPQLGRRRPRLPAPPLADGSGPGACRAARRALPFGRALGHRPRRGRAPGTLPRSSCARSSRPSTPRATSATPGSAARATATSPRRSAATPTSSAIAASCTRSARGRTRSTPRGCPSSASGRRP
jgi:hypothetical protein